MSEPDIHIYRCENPKRVRRLCPYHKCLEYGELQEFYDTHRTFFGESKTKTGIVRIAKCHLKPGGTIKIRS